MIRRRFHGQSGLSLVELLVALTVMAFVTGLATQGLWTGVRVWERGRANATEGAKVELVRQYLRGLIGQAIPLYRDIGRDGGVWFEGSQTEMVFLAPGPRRLPGEGVKRFRLHTVHEGGTRVLRLSWCAEWGKAPVDPCRDEELHVDLVDNIRTLRIAYGPGEAGSWTTMKTLPAHITIEAETSGRRSWQPLTIALPIDQDVTCRFDPVTRDCRRRA